MSIIVDMLSEEKQRNIAMQKRYEEELAKLPKGSLVLKEIGNREYYYLKFRKGKKTITQYLGNDLSKIDSIRKQIAQRKNIQNTLKNLKAEYKVIIRVVKK